MSEFETDGLGNIITQPVTGWALASVADSVVLLQIRYVQTPEELDKDENRFFQFVLTPPKALELAEALTRQARPLMTRGTEPGTKLH